MKEMFISAYILWEKTSERVCVFNAEHSMVSYSLNFGQCGSLLIIMYCKHKFL